MRLKRYNPVFFGTVHASARGEVHALRHAGCKSWAASVCQGLDLSVRRTVSSSPSIVSPLVWPEFVETATETA